MLPLVLPHRHQIRLIQQNIRGHQNRVGEQSRGDVVRVLLGLGLKLGHAAQLTKLGVAAQHPAQLRVLGHMALDEHDVFLGVQAAGDVLGQLVHTAAAQVSRVLPHGDGVHIHDAVQAVIFLLQIHPVANGSHIRAQGQLSAGLNTAEYPLFLLHCVLHSFITPSVNRTEAPFYSNHRYGITFPAKKQRDMLFFLTFSQVKI